LFYFCEAEEKHGVWPTLLS